MDDLIRRFLNKISYPSLEDFEGAYFDKLENDKETNSIYCTIHLKTYQSIEVYNELFNRIEINAQKGSFSIFVKFSYDDETASIKKLIQSFIEEYHLNFMNDSSYVLDEKKVLFYYDSSSDSCSIEKESTELRNFLDNISSTFQILTVQRTYMDEMELFAKEEEYDKKTKLYSEEMEKVKQIYNNYQPCMLKDIEKFHKVIVSGTIFKLGDDKRTKNWNLIRTIFFTDGSDSLSMVLYEGKKFQLEQLQALSVGVKIKVRGVVERDKYNHNELTIRCEDLEVLKEDDSNKRKDDSVEKRVELHLHTKMSPFDGVTSIEDYVKQAKEYGHKAIAITDHGGCQAFPDGQAIGSKLGIKMIYGCEFYVVDDTNDRVTFVYNGDDRDLFNQEYVIFDTETTGLSCRYDRLIEFGAVKVNATGEVTDSIDFFINPDMKISGFSVEKSHITQDMVDKGKPIKEALIMIKKFFGDSILVAHNASFDYDFINEALKNNNMEEIKNPCIDTLNLSRYLYPDMRSHREESLARKFKVEFDTLTAHRASYDAEKLSSIFEYILTDLRVKKPNLKLSELQNLKINKDMVMSMHPYHIIALAKNPDGLKDLFKLISISSTEYAAKNSNPILPRSILTQYRKNLLLGSACFNGSVFEDAMTKGKDKLINEISYFDYIEVQPVSNYSYLVNSGQLTSTLEVEKILKDLIEVSESQNKIVCATSDCHYLNPEDKIYRDIVISANGLGGVRHPLNLAPRDSERAEVKQKWYSHPIPNPDQHFRTTTEMLNEFAFLKDDKLIKRIVIDNTNLIAAMISDDVKPTKTGTFPPDYPGTVKSLTDLTYKTAKELYGDPLPDVIKERLETELNGINSYGYSVIYWLASEIVRWSNDNNYIVGSRGSVGSSLVATMTGITEVNPLPPHYRCPKCKHLEFADVNLYQSGFDLPEKECPDCHCQMIRDGQNIPFATFLGFKADKVPDIDLNFPSDFQNTAHEHMRDILNATGNVCYKAGTIQGWQEKSARGYVLGYFESLGKDTTKIRSAEIDRLAIGCTDVKKTTGQHPGGIIVIPKGMDVYDFTPVQYPADDMDSSWKTTHFDFHKIHDNVLKFDMLGHVDPQAIKMQCDLTGILIKDINTKIPISDKEALSLFWSTDALHLRENVLQEETGALGLPEFGTSNGRRVLKETQPRSFADLVRISGLSHGTNVFAGNAESLILDKGFKLKDVIACRDDIMTVLSQKYGVDPLDAFHIMEFTRKGSFAKAGNLDKKEEFTKILKDHNVPDWYINSCKKIEYMFPKAHAVAYVSNCLRCAWFKVHEPLAYYATFFTLRCDQYDIKVMSAGLKECMQRRNIILNKKSNREKLTALEESLLITLESCIEMYDRGFKIMPLNVNKAKATEFYVDKEHNAIIPPFITVSGLGEAAANKIVQARESGKYTSVEDFKIRSQAGNSIAKKLQEIDAFSGLSETSQISIFDF